MIAAFAKAAQAIGEGAYAEQLIARPKEIYDGAIPAGNNAAALNFLRLARLNSYWSSRPH